jgi:lipopolysaccharide transport system permease protein
VSEAPAAATDAAAGQAPAVIIEPRRGWLNVNLREIWQRRDVLWILVWRDLKVRYKQTVLGVLWAFLQPFTKMIIFSLIFGRLAGMGPEGVPYPVFVFVGILPWEFFAASLTRSSNSVVGQQQFITKVYFPRLIIPLSAIGSALFDFAVSFAILIGLLFWYPEVRVGWSILAVVPLVGLTVVVAMGAGTLSAALNVAYRDVRHIVPFVVQIWLFLTPVIYPVTLIPAGLRWLIALNPMTGIIAAYRWAILGQPVEWSSMVLSCVVAALLFVAGIGYFRRTERVFADIV